MFPKAALKHALLEVCGDCGPDGCVPPLECGQNGGVGVERRGVLCILQML